MKNLFYLFALLVSMATIVACSEKDDEVNAYENWKPRNEVFMKDVLAYANSEIAKAKAAATASGDASAWEDQCDWRVYPSYCVAPGGKTTWEDSIAVRIVERGAGSGCPLYTDTVKVTYAGRLMPTDYAQSDYKKPENLDWVKLGLLFDRSGLSSNVDEVMDPRFEVPATFKVGGLVEGFTTVLMQMHIGDYWRVYIPANMGYGGKASGDIPANSTLVFDMRLKAYYRTGSANNDWK